MVSLTDVVKNLIIINVIVFLAQMVLGQTIDTSMGNIHFPMSEHFRPYQVITSMFMHADIGHLFFNMLSLFFLGPMVERALGAKRFLILYLLAGFVGTFGHIAVNFIEYSRMLPEIDPEVVNEIIRNGRDILRSNQNYSNPLWAKFNSTVNVGALGASGAVYGVVIAFVTMFPKQKLMIFPLPFEIPALYIGIGMVAYGLISGIGSLAPGIAHFAHLGGALMGFIMVHYWKMANLR